MSDTFMKDYIEAPLRDTVPHPLESNIIYDENYMQLVEACESVVFHAKHMIEDRSSTMCTAGRIASIRAVLDLVEGYNEQLLQFELNGGKE